MHEDVPSYMCGACLELFVCMCKDVGPWCVDALGVPSCMEDIGIPVWVQRYVPVKTM